MTGRPKGQLRLRLEAHPCPCGAREGQPCLSKTGREISTTSTFHVARYRAAGAQQQQFKRKRCSIYFTDEEAAYLQERLQFDKSPMSTIILKKITDAKLEDKEPKLKDREAE